MDRTQRKQAGLKSLTFRPNVLACQLACTLMGAAFMMEPAQAGDFTLDNGATVQWQLGTSLGASVRAANPDRALIGVGNGGTAINGMDDGNQNFKKGDVFSAMAKVDGEITIKQGGMGIVLGAKGWYDHRLQDRGVNHGSNANAYQQGDSLDDSRFASGSKFTNTALGNAYAFGSVDLSPSTYLSVKAGNQVVNWGQSMFIPGINGFGAVNATEANRAGAQVKDILLPIPQVAATLSFGDGLSIDAFYQLSWKKSVLDGCGTYWSLADTLNCSNRGIVSGDVGVILRGFPDSATDNYLYRGGNTSIIGGLNFSASVAPEIIPKDDGQFGVSGTYAASSIDTEFGAYYTNYHARTPIFSLLRSASSVPGSYWATALPTQIVWDYSAQNIHVLGASAATVLGGWSLMGEISHARGVPVQINPVDITSANNNKGLQSLIDRIRVNTPVGGVFHGYDLKNKTQIQMSTVKIFPSFINADALTLIGEIGVQHWSGIGDPSTTTRYGRAVGFGYAESAALSCSAAYLAAAQNGATNPHCENKGFFTSSAWGYRILAELNYPGVFAGINVKPRLFISHDVNGYSADSTFVEDRVKLSLGTRFEYNKQYYADLSFTGFNRGATYDVMHDRNFYAAVVGMSF